MTGEEKEVRSAQTAAIDQSKKRIAGIANAAPEVRGMEDALLRQLRRGGGGRAPLHASIDGGLLSYYNKLTLPLGSICPRSLLSMKAAQLAGAGKNVDPAGLDHAFGEDGVVKRAWANDILARLTERRKPKVRETNKRQRLPSAQEALQVNFFFRYSTRIKANYSSVELGMEMFDRAPFYRHQTGETSVGNASTVFPAEEPGGRHTRFTVGVSSATDTAKKPPTELLKAREPTKNKDLQDVAAAAGKKVFLQYGSAATYISELTSKLLNNMYSPPTPAAFLTRTPHILVVDQFRGQMTMETWRRARGLNGIILYIPGGFTGLP